MSGNTSSVARQDSSLIYRWAVYGFLFVILPAGIGSGLLGYSVSLEENRRHQALIERTERTSGAILRSIDPLEATGRRFTILSRATRQAQGDLRRIGTLFRGARRAWGKSFIPFWFTSSGDPADPARLDLPNRFIVGKLWRILTATPDESLREQKSQKKKLVAFLGGDFPLSKLRQQADTIFPIRVKGKEGAIFWSRSGATEKGGLLVISWNPGTPRQWLFSLARRFWSGRYLMIWKEEGEQAAGLGLPLEENRRNEILTTLSGFQNPVLISGGTAWTKVELEEGRLALGIPDPSINLGPLRSSILALSVVLVVLLLHLWYRFLAGSLLIYISIRWKLVILFWLALVLPLSGAAFLGFRIFSDRRQVLESAVIEEAREVLGSLDFEFSGETEKFRTLCRNLRDDPRMASDPKLLLDELTRLQRENRLAQVSVWNLRGETIVRTGTSELMGELGSFFETLGKVGILLELKDRMAAAKARMTDPPDEVTSSLMLSPSLGFNYLLQRRDCTIVTRLVNTQLYYFWDVFPAKSHPAACFSALQVVSQSMKDFFRRRLAPFTESRGPGWKILVRDGETGRFIEAPGSEKIRGVLARRLHMLLDRMKSAQEMTFERVFWNGKPFLAIAAPGKALMGFDLLALYPEGKIDTELGGIRRGIILGILAALIFGAAAAGLLGTHFLLPLRELSKGLEALRKRNSAFRISWYRADELGELASSFNSLIEGFTEMELAKVIQEALLPAGFPEIPGWDGVLSNQTATRLGGDYADILVLPDKRLLLVIGDVTGHGVGAGLLMSMIKAMMFQFSENPTTLPDQIRFLNLMVSRIMKRKIMMTFCAIIIDTGTGGFEGINAGHPYPFILLRGGNLVEIPQNQLPLGTSERREFKINLRGTLSPGDCLVLYTDGFYETTNDLGEQFTYERFREQLGSHGTSDIREILTRTLASFRDFHRNPALDDDCTLLLVKRTEAALDGGKP